MSRKSRTPYAILGALSHGPKSGYDISRLFDTQHLFFWSESYGQIYPTLKRLLDAGMVDMQSEARDNGPERKIYSITQSGEEHLQQWLEESAPEASMRDEQMLKLYFAPSGDKARTIEQLEALQTHIKAQLATLDDEQDALEQQDGEDTLHRELALGWARAYHEARLEWSKSSLEQLTGKATTKKKKKKGKKKKKKNKPS